MSALGDHHASRASISNSLRDCPVCLWYLTPHRSSAQSSMVSSSASVTCPAKSDTAAAAAARFLAVWARSAYCSWAGEEAVVGRLASTEDAKRASRSTCMAVRATSRASVRMRGSQRRDAFQVRMRETVRGAEEGWRLVINAFFLRWSREVSRARSVRADSLLHRCVALSWRLCGASAALGRRARAAAVMQCSLLCFWTGLDDASRAGPPARLSPELEYQLPGSY